MVTPGHQAEKGGLHDVTDFPAQSTPRTKAREARNLLRTLKIDYNLITYLIIIKLKIYVHLIKV